MANMQCELYTKLCREYLSEKMTELSDWLAICALIECQVYSVNAKFYLQQEGLNIQTVCRTRDERELNETARKEVLMLRRLTLSMEGK